MLSDFAIVYEKSENNKLILVLIPIQHDVNDTSQRSVYCWLILKIHVEILC